MVNELKKHFGAYDFVYGHGFFALNAWEVVEVAPDVVVAALVEIDVVFYSDNQVVEISCGDFQLLQFDGSLHDGLSPEGEALGLQRAEKAVGVLRCAMQRAKFHQGLVVKSRLLAVEQRIGGLGEKRLAFMDIDSCVDVEESGEDAVHISVDHSVWQVEGY